MMSFTSASSLATVYHGARGRYHYFLCQQYLLRMQIEVITELWNLPPEFEVKILLRNMSLILT
jgi:hypothetical protein